jgi:hypothetical protein
MRVRSNTPKENIREDNSCALISLVGATGIMKELLIMLGREDVMHLMILLLILDICHLKINPLFLLSSLVPSLLQIIMYKGRAKNSSSM